jgi:hypothetical protein
MCYILSQAIDIYALVDASFSPGRPRFHPGLLHVRFVVDEVALEQVFL